MFGWLVHRSRQERGLRQQKSELWSRGNSLKMQLSDISSQDTITGHPRGVYASLMDYLCCTTCHIDWLLQWPHWWGLLHVQRQQEC